MQKKSNTTILALLLYVGIVLLYLPGVGGAFYYDDYSNLKDLASIDGWVSFWEFVYSGHAGPLGRPLALLTFALQHSAWPGNGEGLFFTNISIHACNAVIVFFLARQLHQLVREEERQESKANEFALIAAASWACSPILASSSLILIQRMTTLAAFFMLLAALIYLKAFDYFSAQPKKRLLLQTLVLGGGTAFATLSKENGILLPALVFTVEISLLKNNAAAAAWRRTRISVLGASVVILLVYISPLVRPWQKISEFRGFSSWERLQGELFILWEYVYLIILPKVAYFGPFQDQKVITDDAVKIYASGIALCGALVGALLYRRKNPWLLFAVSWFLVGHMLESTSLLLEPYYEHRNYIPLVGLSMLFANFSIFFIQKYGSIVRVAVYGYIAINAGVLLMISSLWGKPMEAAKFWVETNPGSIRAVVHQVNLSMGSTSSDVAANNEATLQVNRIVSAMQLLDQTARWCEDCLSIHLQALTYSCIVENENEQRRRIAAIGEILLHNKNRVDISSVDAAVVLLQLISAKRCMGVEYSDVDEILSEMLQQKKYSTPLNLVSKIYYQKATLAYAAGKYSDAEILIKKAEEAWPSAEPVIDYQIEYYSQRKMPEKIIELVNRKLKQQMSGEIHLSEVYVRKLKEKSKEASHEN
ncbi:hypothetical protein [Ottowia sp. VDI28]|uniref:hypothetical protein n=1 Tax=Ottowia sp. VDI28 TaxID=3133968 RepID=UPI003C2FA4C3